MDINKIFEEVYKELRAYYDLEAEFKHYEQFYSEEQIDKGFSLEEHLKDYLLNGFNENVRALKLFSGDDEQDYEHLSLISNSFDFIDELDIQDLKRIIELDYSEYYNIEYFDSFLNEEVYYLFNMDKEDYKKHTHYCQSYSGALYLDLNIDNSKLEDLIKEYNITDEEQLEVEVEYHITENYKGILYYCVYRWLFKSFSIDYKEIHQEWVKLQEKAKEELKIKQEELKKEIEELKQELKVISPKAKIYKILENNIKIKELELD